MIWSLDIEDIAHAHKAQQPLPGRNQCEFCQGRRAPGGQDLRAGVEGETFSCGTGAVASAAIARKLGLVGNEVMVETRGGPLIVSFEGDRAFLEGPAVTVYTGELSDEFRWSLSQET